MDNAAIQNVVLDDADECARFINQHRSEIDEGRYDLRIEKDLVRTLSDEDLLLLARSCPSSRLTIALVVKSPGVLEFLACDSSSDVREAAGDNARTPSNTLEKLADDPASSVRMAAASNPNTPQSTLEKLSRDSINYVRWGVANNERTPAAVLKNLAKDPDGHVQREAKNNPSCPKPGLFARLMGKG
jgi:hypothetical protein